MSRPRVEGLDVLRGLAVGLVLLHHAWPDRFQGAGVVGVVMFFALSGYLITGLLVEEAERTGGLDLARFYRRRAVRLVPALLVLVVGVVVVTLVVDPLHDRHRLARTVVVALTYTGDLPVGGTSAATFHLWTLATEEQFYLLWPFLILLAVRRGRLTPALVLAGGATLTACVATLVWLGEAPDLAYPLPTSWAVCFVIGAVVRVHAHRLPVWPAAAPLALTGLAVLSVIPLRGHALTYLAGGPAIAALTGILLVAWRERYRVDGAARALVWLGGISYAAYLWNYPLTLWLRPSVPMAGLVALPLTVAVATLSTHVIERPVMRRRRPRHEVLA